MLVTSAFLVLVVAVGYNGASAQGLGSTCTTSNDCSTITASICNGGVCACTTNTVASPNNDKCLTKAGHDGICQESIQCDYSEGTECVSGRCSCRADYIFNGYICIGSKGLGDACTVDTECKVPSDVNQNTVWCYNKQCACKRGLKRDGDRCVVGGDCTSDTDCVDLANSFCDQRSRSRYSCNCKENYVAVANLTKCLPVATSLSSGCEYNEQCTYKLGKTECKNFKCQCAAGAVLNKDKTGCSSAIRNVMSVASLGLLFLFKFL